MDNICAPLVADLFLFCYERDFMLSLSDNYQTDIIEAFNSTSSQIFRYIFFMISFKKAHFQQFPMFTKIINCT